MTSLQKDPRGKSPFWYVAHRAPSGKRIYKSTKNEGPEKAWEIALNLERAEVEAAEGRLTEHRVRELLTDTLERTTGRRMKQMPIRAWFTKWLADKEVDGSLSEMLSCARTASINSSTVTASTLIRNPSDPPAKAARPGPRPRSTWRRWTRKFSRLATRSLIG